MSWNNVGKKKQGDATQSLLPDELKTANKKIESLLSSYQNVLRELRDKKNEVGTDNDNSSLRKTIDNLITNLTVQADEIQKEIDEYGRIPVSFNHQKIQHEKHDAYSQRFKDIQTKKKTEVNETQMKMRQFYELSLKQRSDSVRDSSANIDEETGLVSGQLKVKLDSEELKIQGEADYMNEVINQRQENLNHVETAMQSINQIAAQINTKVHEQRHDLEEVNQNLDDAHKNATEAEKHIESASKDQKKSGKCMWWVIGGLVAFVIFVVLIIILKFAVLN